MIVDYLGELSPSTPAWKYTLETRVLGERETWAVSDEREARKLARWLRPQGVTIVRLVAVPVRATAQQASDPWLPEGGG